VTGAARGIGFATAAALIDAGARVVVGDLNGDAVKDAARRLGPRAHGFQLDVTSAESFAAFIAASQEILGPVDVLVNNAGIMPVGAFATEPLATSGRTIDVNLRGVITGTKLVLDGMLERDRGHIVNVSSGLGKIAMPGAAAYVASKHGVVGFTAALRQELQATNVTISAILPGGSVRTDLIAGVPMGGGLPVVEPEQVAHAIVRSHAKPRGEIWIPRWTGVLDPGMALAPEPLQRLFSRLLSGDRLLTSVDTRQRNTYEREVRDAAAQR
jgi:hypothetical protein